MQIIRFGNQRAYQSFWGHLLKRAESSPKRIPVHAISRMRTILCPEPYASELLPYYARAAANIEDDRKLTIHAFIDSAASKDNSPHSGQLFLSWGNKQIQAPKAWKRSIGAGIHVGLIDTGVDFSHPDLKHNLANGINLLYRGALPSDDNGHGTHIAGTIAASSKGGGLLGTAPAAIIHPVKAFDHNGSAYVSDIIRAIEWCIRQRVDIINMSFGMKTQSDSLLDAVKAARRAGIVIVASSGNDGYVGKIDFPASSPYTISVGATTKGRKVASFSNRSRQVDLYAPGEQTTSTWLNGRYKELSGTSMATSHVTGVIALMLALKRKIKPSEMKLLLQSSTLPVWVKGRKLMRKGEINAWRAVRKI